jgi:hypothetical protein
VKLGNGVAWLVGSLPMVPRVQGLNPGACSLQEGIKFKLGLIKRYLQGTINIHDLQVNLSCIS